jgi:ammonia channel protein AmtB
LHGIPGVLGGLFSAIIVAAYNWGYDHEVAAQYGPSNIFQSVHGSFWHQAWLQVAGTFVSVGLGIIFGVIAGKVIEYFYNENGEDFYNDSGYFDSSLYAPLK